MLKNNLMSSRGISTKEYEFYEKELSLLENEAPIPNIEKLENLNLFVTPQHKRREIFFYEIYKLKVLIWIYLCREVLIYKTR